ncbi:MAG: EXLDI protein [Candidatus Levyibacteriota bacterium]
MSNKTIYVSDKDESLFEKAKDIAGEALSSVIARALREYVARNEKKDKDMEEIAVQVGSQNSTREQRFVGKRIGGWSGMSDDKVWWMEAKIFHTQKGKWAIHLATVAKATLFTDPKEWKKSGDYLINVHRGELMVADHPEDLEKKLPHALAITLRDLATKEDKPIEYLDI